MKINKLFGHCVTKGYWTRWTTGLIQQDFSSVLIRGQCFTIYPNSTGNICDIIMSDIWSEFKISTRIICRLGEGNGPEPIWGANQLLWKKQKGGLGKNKSNLVKIQWCFLRSIRINCNVNWKFVWNYAT